MWIITLPQSLKDEVRIYGIRRGLKIWETVDEAVTKYFDTIDSLGAVEDELKSMEDYEEWSVQIDKDKYKRFKILCIEKDISIYDLINTALYRLVYQTENQ